MGTPLLIKAFMASPIAGDAPMIDAVLERHAFTKDIDGCSKLSTGRQLNTHDALTYDMLDCVPLDRHTFDDGSCCYCCSSPIVDTVAEYTEHYVRRMDYKALKDQVNPKDIGKLRQVTGPYSPSFEPHRTRTVRAIAWYVVGDRERLQAWLDDVHYLGGKTAAGYGIVSHWSVEPSEDRWMAHDGVLMRPVPVCAFSECPKGARPYYGAIKPPYWHPMRQQDIYKPC